MKKTHWKKLDNPNYLGAYSLIDGETKEMTFTIEKVVLQKAGKNDDECKVAYLKDSKPMILNTTNCKVIEKIYNTPFIEDWAGKSIIVFVQKVKAFGDMVDALRIRPIIPKTLPELLPNTDTWHKVIKGIENGFTIDQIKTKYKISNENEKKLTNERV
jgi:hypothetical protein